MALELDILRIRRFISDTHQEDFDYLIDRLLKERDAYREVAKVVCPGCGGIGWNSKAHHAPGCDGETCRNCPIEEQVQCDCYGFVDAEAQRILQEKKQ